jgi:uncharacterized protein YwqG
VFGWVAALAVAALLAAAAWFLLRRSADRERVAYAAETDRLRSIAPPTGDAWRTLLAAEQLGAYVDALAPRVRPAIRLTTTPSENLRPGQSRVGGRPDLPADLPWPTHGGTPLGFLAQVAIAELPDGPAPAALPSDGHLWFFYVADQSTWGFDPKDAGSARVLYRPGSAVLTRAEPPETLPDGGEYAACAVSFEGYEDLPDIDTDHPLNGRLAEAELERYLGIRDYLANGDGDARHKLLGHAQPVQNPMELECALVTSGLYCGDQTGYEDPRAAEIGQQAERWRLLLQLDSDDHASMTWGDLGTLYFWIRDDDLAARRFERAWMILQCH